MRHPFTRLFTKTASLLVLVAGSAVAQENLPMGPSNYEHDFQMFAPFDLDLDNSSEDQWSGYFFEYNKLAWSYSSERVTVGNTELIDDNQLWRDPLTGIIAPLPAVEGAYAEIIYRFNPQDADFTDGDIINLPPPFAIDNTLKNVPPRAGFALGNRYELGYQDQGHGWMIGILDGPDMDQRERFGFERDAALGGGLPPFIDPDYTDGTDVGPGGGPIAGGEQRAFGFGAVPILFETPPGYLIGFRDYMNNFSDAALGTQAGIMRYIGNYGASEDPDSLPIPFLHLADDIDGDGVLGAFPVIIIDPILGPLIGFVHDFDDLHEFNIYFDTVDIRSHTETNGIELMWTHHLTNRHYMAKHRNNRLSVAAGARFLRLEDQFRVDAFGSILHDAFWDTTFTNQIVGPQVAMSWVNQRQRWRLSADTRFLFGYNIADWEQDGLTGAGMIPGGLNQPIYGRPTAFSYGLQKEMFSPVGELRLQASYHIFEGAAFKFGYTGSYIGNIKRAAPSVRYRLPDMGYQDAGGQTLVVNGFDFGVEFIY